MSGPKVGEEGWFWHSYALEKDFPVKVLEISMEADGVYRYFVSYDSDAMGRRCVTSKVRSALFKKPLKVVSYQLMSVDASGFVQKHKSSVYISRMPKEYYTIDDNTKIFIQRTEVTGDKIEVFVEKTL